MFIFMCMNRLQFGGPEAIFRSFIADAAAALALKLPAISKWKAQWTHTHTHAIIVHIAYRVGDCNLSKHSSLFGV